MFSKEYKIIKKSGLFDGQYYLKTYEDVRKSDIDAIKHYVKHGWKEGRNPSEQFDTNFYLETYPDVRDAGLNPLVHFVLHGKKEGRIAHPYLEIFFENEINKRSKIIKIINIIRHVNNNRGLVKKFVQEIKSRGLKVAAYKALKELQKTSTETVNLEFTTNSNIVISSYESWKNVNKLCLNRLKYISENLEKCEYQPLISIIIPVYNPPLEFFIKAIKSVENQIYKNFEICIVDDCSSNTFTHPYLENLREKFPNINVAYNDVNSHISITTNNAVNLANGEYLVFLDQDDELTFDALSEIVLYLNKHTNCDLLYSDDDKIDTNGHCFDPQFKPDWSPEYLLSFMYCGHLKCVSKELYLNVGGFRKGYEGSQDYDFYLRASEKAKMIGHIPRILYHWRVIPGSTAAGGNEKHYSFEAGLKAVQDALIRRNIQGKVHHPKWALNNGNGIYAIKFPDTGKSVGIIIPTKNGYDLLKRCVESLKATTYKNYKIYIIDNESDEQKTINYLKNLNQCEILRIPSKNGKFSFSYINNEAVKFVKEELVLFLNNDTEVINERWLSQMVGYMQFEGVGSVGARLLFPDNRIQHAGIIHGITNGFPITSGRLLADWEWGYLASTVTSKNFTAVTAACMLTPKKLFEEVGGFDDIEFSVAFNDCDYGYKLHQKGFRNVLAPEAKLYHYEGASRGHGDKPSEESSYIKKYGKWKDPFYNLNLANNSSNYGIASKSVVLHSISKFRVLMVTHNLNLEGAPKSFYEIVKGIKKIGLIEPVVVSHVDGPLRKIYDEIGVEVNILKDFNLFSMTNEKEINSFIDEKVKLIKSLNIELIYGNTIEAFWAMHCAKKMNLPCVWNIRESEEPFSSYNHNLQIKKYMINAMAYPYKIVFVANATQVVYEPLNTQNNFITIYNGFDEEIAKQKTIGYDRTIVREKLNVEENELAVLILGTVCERKGQKDLIKAIELLSDETVKNMKFIIVGDRKTLDYSKEMHQLINQLPNEKKNRVVVVDETPEIHKYYTASDIFVCSSRVESFPKVIQEAMYYQLAIVTTPVYGIVEQVKDNTSALYYQPADVQTLSRHLETLSKDVALRNKISINAKMALGIFPNINEMASQYEEVFKEAWLSGECR